jgi:hypothetical protein
MVSRILFLLLTPVFFRIFNFGFIWHSIYWGVISFVILIWFFFLLISPLFGRIGCGSQTWPGHQLRMHSVWEVRGRLQKGSSEIQVYLESQEIS